MKNDKLAPVWENLIIQRYNEVDSTNEAVKDYLKQQPQQEILMIAKKQRNGRGRRGRSFYSKLDHGLYFSLGFQVKDVALKDLSLYTIAAATAMLEAIGENLGLKIQVKWVNDLFYQGRKIAGILSETILVPQTNKISHLVVGLGLNLAGSFEKADAKTKKTAGSLYENLPTDFDLDSLLRTFLIRFKSYHRQLTARHFIPIYKEHLLGLGQIVDYQRKNKKYSGRITGIDDFGRLRIENYEGQEVLLLADEIHFSSHQFVQGKE